MTNSCRRPASDVRELTYRHERPLFFLINLQRMHPCNWYASLPHSTCLARRYHIGNNARLFLSPPTSSSSTAKRVSYESPFELARFLPASFLSLAIMRSFFPRYPHFGDTSNENHASSSGFACFLSPPLVAISLSRGVFSSRLKYEMLTLLRYAFGFPILRRMAFTRRLRLTPDPRCQSTSYTSYLSHSFHCSCALFMDVLRRSAARYLFLKCRFSKLSSLWCYCKVLRACLRA